MEVIDDAFKKTLEGQKTDWENVLVLLAKGTFPGEFSQPLLRAQNFIGAFFNQAKEKLEQLNESAAKETAATAETATPGQSGTVVKGKSKKRGVGTVSRDADG